MYVSYKYNIESSVRAEGKGKFSIGCQLIFFLGGGMDRKQAPSIVQ